MIPIDYRNLTWESIQETLTGRRLEVLTAWRAYGPATTREIAQASGIDILAVRPRTTELLDIGLIELLTTEDDRACRQHEGIYRARTEQAVRTWIDWRRRQPVQAELPLVAATGD